MRKNYVIKDNRLVRTNPFCPRCGNGVFMADKGEWWSCGKCGDKYYKKGFEFKGGEERWKSKNLQNY